MRNLFRPWFGRFQAVTFVDPERDNHTFTRWYAPSNGEADSAVLIAEVVHPKIEVRAS